MQRSSHETDSTSSYLHTSTNIIEHYFVHASVIIFAQYFYYAKITARDRFFCYAKILARDRFDQIFTHVVSHYQLLHSIFVKNIFYYCTVFLLCKDSRILATWYVLNSSQYQSMQAAIYHTILHTAGTLTTVHHQENFPFHVDVMVILMVGASSHMRITSYIYKIIKNNRRKFSFLVRFLRSNGGLSRRRSATAKFRYTFYGRSTPASFVDAISPLRRPPTTAAAAAPMANPFPPPVVLLPPVAIVSNHSRLKYLIFGGDPLIQRHRRATEPSTALPPLERQPIATTVIIWTLFWIKFASTSPIHIQHGITIRYDSYAKILARDPRARQISIHSFIGSFDL